MTVVQEDSGQRCTRKELDESGEADTAQKSRSTKEMDKLGEGDFIEPVMEETFKEKKDERYEEEKKLIKKAVPKRKKRLSWWKK